MEQKNTVLMDTPVLYDDQNTFRGVMKRLFKEGKLAGVSQFSLQFRVLV